MRCQKGALLGTFFYRKVAGGDLGVDLGSQRGVQKGGAKKDSLQGVKGDKNEGGVPIETYREGGWRMVGGGRGRARTRKRA